MKSWEFEQKISKKKKEDQKIEVGKRGGEEECTMHTRTSQGGNNEYLGVKFRIFESKFALFARIYDSDVVILGTINISPYIYYVVSKMSNLLLVRSIETDMGSDNTDTYH